jgi:enediyne polyketide synthase
VLENVEFQRPIVIPVAGSATIRLAALNRGGSVDVVIRSSDTSFQADHFRATLRWVPAGPADADQGQAADNALRVPLDPGRDLYGGILFQGKRFQRVLGYRRLAATSCVAEISAQPADGWFSAFFPAGLVLGDPGARDAFMHAIQCCVPNATLLPAGIARLHAAEPGDGASRVVLHARERHRDGDTYTYDLDVRDIAGRLVERWEGLRLRAVRKNDGAGPWLPVLLGPYLERQLAELLPRAPQCVVEPDGAQRTAGRAAARRHTRSAVSRMLGRPVVVRYRGDGKPEVAGDVSISVSHTAGVTLAVAAAGRVSCDVELVQDRTTADWQALLSPAHFPLAELIAREREEGLPVAATRVWGAIECLHKVGQAVVGPITLAESRPDGWVLLGAGEAQIATFPTYLRDEAAPVVFTTLTEGGS